MKLAYSAASPYVRKVNACAIARSIDAKIERWKVGTTDPALLDCGELYFNAGRLDRSVALASGDSVRLAGPRSARIIAT